MAHPPCSLRQASDKRGQQLGWRQSKRGEEKEWEMEAELAKDEQTSLTDLLLVSEVPMRACFGFRPNH